MITKKDLYNLKHLITSNIDEKISHLKSNYRTFRRKLRAGRLFAKPEPFTPLSLLSIIRNTHPSSIAGEIFADWPMKKPEPEEQVTHMERVPFNEISISGGWRHTFGQGFSYSPWMLVQETGEKDVCNVPKFGLKIIQHRRVLEKLWPSWRVDLPEKTRARWQKRIDAHNALIEDVKKAQDRLIEKWREPDVREMR